MKLPKTLTTITPVSKFLALILFITFPLVGFYLGMQYQKSVQLSNSLPIDSTNNSSDTLPSNVHKKTYKTEIMQADYPNDWFQYGVMLSNFDQGKFVSYVKTSDLMKTINNPVIIHFGNIQANDDQLKLPLDQQMKEWGEWLSTYKANLESEYNVIITHEEQFVVDGRKTELIEVCTDNPDYAVYRGYACHQQIYIPYGEGSLDITVYGDKEAFSQARGVINSIKFYDK